MRISLPPNNAGIVLNRGVAPTGISAARPLWEGVTSTRRQTFEALPPSEVFDRIPEPRQFWRLYACMRIKPEALLSRSFAFMCIDLKALLSRSFGIHAHMRIEPPAGCDSSWPLMLRSAASLPSAVFDSRLLRVSVFVLGCPGDTDGEAALAAPRPWALARVLDQGTCAGVPGRPQHSIADEPFPPPS